MNIKDLPEEEVKKILSDIMKIFDFTAFDENLKYMGPATHLAITRKDIKNGAETVEI